MRTPIEGITAPLTPASLPAPRPAQHRADAQASSPRDDPAADDWDDMLGIDELELLMGIAPDAPPATASRRGDGWTPDRQRRFLDLIAGGCTVEAAAAQVGLSSASAYAFRKRAAGAAFALGWQAALLLQRQRLADELTARAFDGNTDTFTNAKGEVMRRHRFDNRLGLAMLTRLDRLAEGRDAGAEALAARLAAQDFESYLDLIGADRSPAQAALFLSLRGADGGAAGTAAGTAEAIAPIVALARADLYRRTRSGDVGEVRVDDLDPAQRHAWSADQWARAEAGGLLTLAAPPAAVRDTPQHPQHSPDTDPVWWDDDAQDWRTRFPPPLGFAGEEDGVFGESGYTRALSVVERAAVEEAFARSTAKRCALEEPNRCRYFAALLATDEDDVAQDVATGAPQPA